MSDTVHCPKGAKRGGGALGTDMDPTVFLVVAGARRRVANRERKRVRRYLVVSRHTFGTVSGTVAAAPVTTPVLFRVG